MKFISFTALQFLILFTVSAKEFAYEISVCTIFKNEAPYLKEWINYHMGIGVNHFYLYNNESEDNFQEVLQPYIDAGIVQVTFWPNLWKDKYFAASCQPYAYQHCIDHHRNESKWFCFIDTDEFIVPMREKSLRKCLRKRYSNKAAVWAQWRCFGTSFVTVPPGESLLQNLIMCSSKDNIWNGVGKTIVRSEAIAGVALNGTDPHFVDLKKGYYCNGSGKKGLSSSHKDKYIRINHYVYRDESSFEKKVARHQGYGGIVPGGWVVGKEEMIQRNIEFCQEIDTAILK
jgi:hypothetical protein